MKVGDRVRIVGPTNMDVIMTVASIGSVTDANSVECYWFDVTRALQIAWIPLAILQQVQE